MRKLFTIILLTYLCATCTTKNTGEPDASDLFIKLFGGGKGEKINDAILLPSGETVIVGSSRSFSTLGAVQNYIFIAKIDPQGNKIWQKAIEGNTNETIEGNSIRVLPDGKFIILATSNNIELPITKKITLIKATADGLKENIVTLPANPLYDLIGVSMQLQPDFNNFLIVGKKQTKGSIDVAPTENYIANFTTNLNKNFDKFYSSEAFVDNTPLNMKTIYSREFLIAGSVNYAPRLILIDDELGIKWDYNYKNAIPQGAIQNLQIIGNGYVGTGISISSNVNGTTRPFLLKTSIDGIYQWHKILDLQALEVNAITSTTEGGFMVVGTIEITEGEAKHTNIWVAKLTEGGDIVWQKNFGGRKNEVGKVLIATPNETYSIFGNVGYEDTNMVGLIRIDKNGNLVK